MLCLFRLRSPLGSVRRCSDVRAVTLPFGILVCPQDEAPPRKRQRTSEDFISFCKFILEYENYESIKQEELREKAASPSDSSADSVDSLKQHADVSDGDAARGRSTRFSRYTTYD